MAGERPHQITTEHLARLAYLYLRVSTPTQARNNLGSITIQRELRNTLVAWGWKEDRIRVIEEDLGRSGTTAEGRVGYQEMLEDVRRGGAGIVMVYDESRRNRNVLEEEILLQAALEGRVLLAAGTQVYDPCTASPTETLFHRIKGLFSWFDNELRKQRIRESRLAKIQKGWAVTRPPLGYRRVPEGRWTLDPDPEVQARIRLLFRLYLELQSITKVVRYCREHGLLFPRRTQRGEHFWEPLTPMTVSHILTNPNYTGDYVADRCPARWRARHETGAYGRRSMTPRDQWLVTRDHHEGYVSREDWERIQELLVAHRVHARPTATRGSALLHDLVVCGPTGRRLRVSYKIREEHT